MAEWLPLALSRAMSVQSHAVPRSASSGTIPFDLMRQAGVCRLESVEAACAALLTGHVDRMRQDKALSLQQDQLSITMPLRRADVQQRDLRCDVGPCRRSQLARAGVLSCSCTLVLWLLVCIFLAPGQYINRAAIVLTDWAARAASGVSRARVYVTDCHISVSEHSCASSRCTHSGVSPAAMPDTRARRRLQCWAMNPLLYLN